MKQKSTLTLDNEFIQYCELNNIKDINKVAMETFNRGFSFLKYGEFPIGNKTTEVIKEVIKEIPVEIIKEVRIEVPVEKIVEIIKEVPVKTKGKEKIVIKEVEKLIVDVEKEKEIEKLKEENKKLQEELDKITKALEKIGNVSYMKNSNLSSLYDE
jgi:hypothetical protein